MTALPMIVAPNLTFEDDSLGGIVTRVLARLAAKGCGVQGVYVDNWQASSRPDTVRLRGWSVDVVESTEGDPLDQAVIGSVEIMETEKVHLTLVRGHRTPVRETRRHFAIGFSGGHPLLARLGLQDLA